jgi:hypothetical protein
LYVKEISAKKNWVAKLARGLFRCQNNLPIVKGIEKEFISSLKEML